MRRGWLIALLSLAFPGAAQAHVLPKPPFVTADVESAVTLETPNERRGTAMTELRVTTPPDVLLEDAAAPPGWRVSVTGGVATYSGGTLPPGASIDFEATVRATKAGTSRLSAVQRFDDERAVTWDVDLAVLPATGAAAPDQHLGRAFVAGTVGLFAVAFSLLALHRLRRRSLQES